MSSNVFHCPSVVTKMSQISISSDSGEEMCVESIQDRRFVKGRLEYLIKWKGFENQDTWEPIKNLKQFQHMVLEFDKKYDKKSDSAAVPESSEKKTQPRPEHESPPKPAKKLKSEGKTKVEGAYEDNDSAKEILNIRKDNETRLLEFYVAWKPRKNSRAPQPSWITDELLKLHNPEVLSEYLLKKIKWPK